MTNTEDTEVGGHAMTDLELRPPAQDLINTMLPKELILKIFSFLDILTLCRCAQVSKYWNKLALDGDNWQSVSLFDFRVAVQGQTYLAKEPHVPMDLAGQTPSGIRFLHSN